ncbi:hypothetical protein [Oceanobacillus profundus]|nr:hypothetical protein [Oceanobacillus profundus]
MQMLKQDEPKDYFKNKTDILRFPTSVLFFLFFAFDKLSITS